jgi:hypothetical protein
MSNLSAILWQEKATFDEIIMMSSAPENIVNNSPRPQNHSKVSLDRIFTGWFDSCIAAFIGIFSLLLTVEIYGCNRIK